MGLDAAEVRQLRRETRERNVKRAKNTKKVYVVPPTERDLQRRREEANARRRVLRQAGLTTFVVGMRGGEVGIICLCCGLGSSNLDDVAEEYCGFCGVFHEFVPE